MDLSFEIGTREKHHVEFYWDQMWGRLRITVDGERVVKTLSMLSFRLVKAFDRGRRSGKASNTD
jgi:hypothetical protein